MTIQRRPGGVSRWGGGRRLAAFVVAGLLIAQAGRALFIDVQFFGGVDIGAFETYAWRTGDRADNYEVEAAIRAAVEEWMATKGYRRLETGDTADAYVRTRVLKDRDFPAGVLKVEVVDAGSEELVWLGMATGVVVTDKPKRVAKVVRQSIRKMFKRFPARGPLK